MTWTSYFRRRYSYGPLSIDSNSDYTVAEPEPLGHTCRSKAMTCCKSSRFLTIFSVVWLALMLALGAGLCAFLLTSADLEIDKSLNAFTIPNHETSRRAAALELAMHEYNQPDMRIVTKRDTRHRATNDDDDNDARVMNLRQQYHDDSLSDGDGGGDGDGAKIRLRKRSPFSEYGLTQRILRWKLQLAYIAIGDPDPNIMTRERIETIHRIENVIRTRNDYPNFCWKDYNAEVKDPMISVNNGCAPINSLLTYFYPTIDESSKQVHYNGFGDQLIDVDSALDLAMSHDSFFYFVGDTFNKTFKKGRLLHSEVFFGAPIDGYMDVIDRPDEQSQKFKDFIVSYIDQLSKASTDKVQVLYGGNEIYDYEVDTGFWTDMRLATASLTTIAVLMLVLTSFSVWLTVCGLFSIVLSFPAAMLFYRLVFGIRSLGILNGAAAFVIVGIGVDDVFVFINTFRQFSHQTSVHQRLLSTIKTAGKATFFTSFTTSAAFAANISSSIPAVHDFGLFMSLIVACCWLSTVLVLPPALVLWTYGIVRCENACCKSCDDCQGDATRPEELTQFFGDHGATSDVNGRHVNVANDDVDDDAQLLRLDSVATSDSGLWVDLEDDPLLLLENELALSISQSEQAREGCSMTSRLQVLLYSWLAVPVVKWRWVIVAVYASVLVVGIGLITQISVADQPPKFFKPESNLQRFYDLKANLSIDVLNCYQCSAFYEMTKTAARGTANKADTNSASAPPFSTTHATSTLIPTAPATKRATEFVTTSPTHSTSPGGGDDDVIALPTSSVVLPTKAAAPAGVSTHVTSAAAVSTRPAPVSAPKDFKACGSGSAGTTVCGPQAEQTVKKSMAPIYVVFGIRDLDRSNVAVNHVIADEGEVIYDTDFEKAFNFSLGKFDGQALRDLCKLCKLIGNNSELVVPGSAQCLPKKLPREIEYVLSTYAECRDLPRNKYVFDHQLPVRSVLMFGATTLKWIAFAYQSTSSQSDSYFRGYHDYQRWEAFVEHIKADVLAKGSPLTSIYQVSPFWKNVFMEVIAVSSAIYGLVLSLMICMAAVAVFTGHLLLLFVVLLSIFGMIVSVVGLFYVIGWQIGAVEAISLSILVGSSVDYCVHLVEGYLLAGRHPPTQLMMDKAALRGWRTRSALTRLGISILSSALTTLVAAIPLTQTTIQPFAQFGRIVALCTLISIVYTVTACSAFLATFAPAHFTSTWRSTLLALLATCAAVGVFVLILYLVTLSGVTVPGPNGSNLFS